MAEHEEQGERTEEPTPRRLEKAREEGQVASSREVHNLFLLGVATLLLATAGQPAGRAVADLMRRMFLQVADVGGDGTVAASLLPLLLPALLIILVPALGFAVAAVLASAVQNAIVWNTKTLAGGLSRLSPVAGARRLLSLRTLIEFGKSVAKLAIATGAAVIALYPELGRVRTSPELAPEQFGRSVHVLTLRLLIAVCVAVALVAAVDYVYQRHDFLKRMRMSRRDIREEHKESEGDPLIRQRLRAIRMERARRRMMAEVPKSTVVVTNPTHYAVALRYRQGKDAVPEVVAKGVDAMASRIRELARAHGVPIVEDPPLARILYATVELGKPIPPAQYEAVARVIAFVMRLGRTSPRQDGF